MLLETNPIALLKQMYTPDIDIYHGKMSKFIL